MKKIIAIISLLGLSSFAFANDISLTTAINLEAKKFKGCDVLKKMEKHEFSPDFRSLLLVLPYEGCGGGNNWGHHVVLFKDFDGKNWKSRKEVDIINVEKIQFKDGEFIVDSLDYGDNDPRCCPSVKKKTKVSAN